MASPTSNEPERFRDRLLDAEPVTPEYRERYQREVNAMLERQLKSWEKAAVGMTGVLTLGFSGWFVYLAAVTPHLPALARGGLLAGALLSAAWSAGTAYVVRRGTLPLQAAESAISAWVWILGVVLTTLFLVGAPRLPGNQGVLLVLSGLCVLLYGAASLIMGRVRQSETSTRLKLLEIELSLAELREELGRQER